MNYIGGIINDDCVIYFFKEGFYVLKYHRSEDKTGWYPAKKLYVVKNIDLPFYTRFNKLNPFIPAGLHDWLGELPTHAPSSNDIVVCVLNADDASKGDSQITFLQGYFDPSDMNRQAALDCVQHNNKKPTVDLSPKWASVVTPQNPFPSQAPQIVQNKTPQNVQTGGNPFLSQAAQSVQPPSISIHQLNQFNWGVCNFVAAIQAAYDHGKTALLKATSYDTLFSVIEGFYAANPKFKTSKNIVRLTPNNTGKTILVKTLDITRQIEIDKVYYPIDTALAMAKSDSFMQLKFKISQDVPELKALWNYLDLNFTYFSCPAAPVTLENLSLKNVIYSVYGKEYGGHTIYVDKNGWHYSWGQRYSAEDMVKIFTEPQRGIVYIDDCCVLDGAPVALLQKYSIGDPYIATAYDLDEKKWGMSAIVAGIQAGIFNAKNRASFQLSRALTLDSTSRTTLTLEFIYWHDSLEPSVLASVESELHAFTESIYGAQAVIQPFSLESIYTAMKEDKDQVDQIAFAVTPNVMKQLLGLRYDFEGFELIETAPAASELTPANLKYKNAIYGFGRSDRALHNGLMYWAYVDHDGMLCARGKMVKPGDIVNFLEHTELKLNKITHVIQFQ